MTLGKIGIDALGGKGSSNVRAQGPLIGVKGTYDDSSAYSGYLEGKPPQPVNRIIINTPMFGTPPTTPIKIGNIQTTEALFISARSGSTTSTSRTSEAGGGGSVQIWPQRIVSESRFKQQQHTQQIATHTRRLESSNRKYRLNIPKYNAFPYHQRLPCKTTDGAWSPTTPSENSKHLHTFLCSPPVPPPNNDSILSDECRLGLSKFAKSILYSDAKRREAQRRQSQREQQEQQWGDAISELERWDAICRGKQETIVGKQPSGGSFFTEIQLCTPTVRMGVEIPRSAGSVMANAMEHHKRKAKKEKELGAGYV
jgi:hypothetical protein